MKRPESESDELKSYKREISIHFAHSLVELTTYRIWESISFLFIAHSMRQCSNFDGNLLRLDLVLKFFDAKIWFRFFLFEHIKFDK